MTTIPELTGTGDKYPTDGTYFVQPLFAGSGKGVMSELLDAKLNATLWKRQAEDECRSKAVYQNRCDVLEDEVRQLRQELEEERACLSSFEGHHAAMELQLVRERDEARRVAAGLLRLARDYAHRFSREIGESWPETSLEASVRKLVEG